MVVVGDCATNDLNLRLELLSSKPFPLFLAELPFAHHLVINALALDHLKFMVNSLQSLDRL
ncbi:hypothetical protein OUZ56_000832 [Daphnia magna]|uniref:Uncharacterized protein n=1 Tax=Daphnia magna TaxID=35525 RepID=A0ABR0A1G9_9CRUS|nr:hypothetical protein OUZ56_000832 [Daphnia magna]